MRVTRIRKFEGNPIVLLPKGVTTPPHKEEPSTCSTRNSSFCKSLLLNSRNSRATWIQYHLLFMVLDVWTILSSNIRFVYSYSNQQLTYSTNILVKSEHFGLVVTSGGSLKTSMNLWRALVQQQLNNHRMLWLSGSINTRQSVSRETPLCYDWATLVWLSQFTCTVSFHNFKSQNFKLSVSNPKNKYVVYLSVLSQISNCQSLGRKNKHEHLKTDRT